MFESSTYNNRRNKLKKLVKSGVLFFPGNNESPMNYAGNTYPYRQDSSFLYYWGLDTEGLAALIDIDSDKEIIFGDERSVDDVVWMGPEQPLTERAESVGVKNTLPYSDLEKTLKEAQQSGMKILYLPQYRSENIILINNLLGIHHSKVNENASIEFTKAVINQRSVKSHEEIEEIEKAVDISYAMNTEAMMISKPGIYEREVYGAIEGVSLSLGCGISFPIIFSVHGETLHNHHHDNLMKDGDMLVLDSGAESPLHYASDITRSFPVNGKFSEKQKEIYNIVLDSQLKSIEMMKPGVMNKDVHLTAAKVIAEGMKNLGFMKGNIDDAVTAGAHALFFPHGLGHMMGLDVHDLEGLGENLVGYNDNVKRSDQFGLAYLRFGKELKPGYVLTIEPGIYFIPQLIDSWKAENKFTDFINYEKVETYKDFGGIRIEDDILVTDDGCRVLGKPIPKTIEEVEEECRR